MKKTVFTLLFGLWIGAGCSWIYFSTYHSQSMDIPLAGEEAIEDDGAESNALEAKIEELGRLDQGEHLAFGGNIEELFGDCDPDKEIEALENRFECNKRVEKSLKFWKSMAVAEESVMRLLISKNTNELFKYFGCDSNDLTWYEMHCEADRTAVKREHLAELLEYVLKNKLNIESGLWVRLPPDPRKLRNSRWLFRSRLVLKGFRLTEPWASEVHPTENETLILLEQKLNGRISIVGIPLTGVLSNDEE